MINQNNFTKRTETDGTSMPHDEGTKSRFADYGKKSLMPLVDLLTRYKSDIRPYTSTIVLAFDGALQALENSEENEAATQRVTGWLREAREWVNGSSEKLQQGSPKEFISYLERLAERNPGLMFSASYVVGMLFGRVGRYVGHLEAEKSTERTSQGANYDDQIH